jgi:hypothetical protein
MLNKPSPKKSMNVPVTDPGAVGSPPLAQTVAEDGAEPALEWTPGPWKAEKGNAGTDHPLFVTAPGKDGFRPWTDDDARLISTAPDGYKLAEMVLKYFGDDEISDLMNCDIALRDGAWALLAKARGETDVDPS